MGTFAGALGRGLAGYAQNRERADARDADLAQQQRAEARQAMLDERQRVQMEAQAQAMKEERERRQAQDARQGEQDRNAALDDGLRDTEPTRQMGTLMRGAAELGGGMGGPMGASLGALRSAGNVNTEAASGPQYSVGGKSMSRAALPFAQLHANMKAKEQRGEKIADREYEATQAETSADKQLERQKKLAAYQKSLAPRPERQPVTQMGNDGNMYFSEDGGRTWNQSRMAGGAAPAPDRPAPTEVPTQRPALSDSTPGSGFSRGFTAPAGQQPPSGGSSPQQPAQPPRGVFGKLPESGGMGDGERKAYNDAEAASRQLVNLLGQYKGALQANGVALMNGSDPKRAAMSSLQRQILALYKGPAFANLGVLAGPDMELLDDIVSPPTGIGAWNKGKDAIAAQIDEVLQNAEMARRTRHEVLRLPYQPLVQPKREPLDNIFGGGR